MKKFQMSELMTAFRWKREQQVRARIYSAPELTEYHAEIFYDWPNDIEHLEWLALAPISEILDWAQTVQQEEE